MLVAWATQKAKQENIKCFSACTNDAKANVYRILERAGWSLKEYEAVLPGEGLGVFGEWKGCAKPSHPPPEIKDESPRLRIAPGLFHKTSLICDYLIPEQKLHQYLLRLADYSKYGKLRNALLWSDF